MARSLSADFETDRICGPNARQFDTEPTKLKSRKRGEDAAKVPAVAR
ncbi:hypothetical protein [Lichenibacterium ramalinae]|nr:hypothetical protein [Lichenibacterium ramalinae]